MKIYKKLQEARCELSQMNLKRSHFAKIKAGFGYAYYELKDILPAITEVCGKLGLSYSVNIGKEESTLVLYDVETDENVVFTTFFGHQENNASGFYQAVQNAGGRQTYVTRYLLLSAFQISENDYIEPAAAAAKVTAAAAEAQKKEAAVTLDVKQQILLRLSELEVGDARSYLLKNFESEYKNKQFDVILTKLSEVQNATCNTSK